MTHPLTHTVQIASYEGVAPYLHSPTWALNQTGAKVYTASVPGGQGDPTTHGWLPVWNWTQQADLVIYAGGIDNDVEAEDHDRHSIAWSGAQLDVIEQVSSYGAPTIVLQMGGGQIDSAPIANNPNVSALIWGGYPGQDGGPALIDTITGKNAPAGRLPTTQYPANYIAQVPMTDMSLRPNATSGNPGRRTSGTRVMRPSSSDTDCITRSSAPPSRTRSRRATTSPS